MLPQLQLDSGMDIVSLFSSDLRLLLPPLGSHQGRHDDR
jgi:hypothetical protein